MIFVENKLQFRCLALKRRFFASFSLRKDVLSILSAAPHPCSAIGSKINVFLAGTEQECEQFQKYPQGM